MSQLQLSKLLSSSQHSGFTKSAFLMLPSHAGAAWWCSHSDTVATHAWGAAERQVFV